MRARNKIKGIGFFFYLCLMLAFVPGLRANAAEPTEAPEFLYATYYGDTLKVGDKIDLEKLVVTAYYADGSSENVTDFEISTDEVEAAGDNKIVISYKGKTTTFQVSGKKVTSIYVTYHGDMVSIGNSVGKSDLTVLGYFSDGSIEEIRDYTLEGEVIHQAGYQSVFVLYEGLADSVRVFGRIARTPETLTVEYLEDSVIQGNSLNPEYLIVTAVYWGGSTERIHNYTLDPQVLNNIGTNTVTIAYMGRTVKLEVECVVKTLERISAEYDGSYVEVGHYVDRENLKIIAHYNDGSTEELEDYILSPERILLLGNNMVTVEYKDLFTEFKVIGVEKIVEDYSNASVFTVTNGTKKGKVEVALPKKMVTDTLTGRSLKPDRVKKVLGKVDAQDAEYIAFDVILADETADDIFPLNVRITIPSSYDIANTNVYYTPNRKTVIARMNVERIGLRKMELTIFHPGTYIIAYQEPEITEEEKESEEDSDYLD